MQYVNLANGDLRVSRIAFGCWGIVADSHWGPRSDTESADAIHAALDAGVNLFDTAAMYGDGASEELLGRTLGARRRECVLATKMKPDEMSGDAIERACDAALRRLRTDYIDLFQIHWPHREVPLEQSWRAMQRLRDAGKVRYLGVCNFGANDLQALTDLECPLTNQLPYSPIWRAIEFSILPSCRQHDVGVLVYSPLMHGLLTDRYATAEDVPAGRARTRHFSRQWPQTRHQEDGQEEETFRVLGELRILARQLNTTTATLSLQWLLSKDGIRCLLVGARNRQQVAENLTCLGEQPSPDILKSIDALTEPLRNRLGDNADLWQSGHAGRIR